tara:strand:+ start:232 stop:453 length:222 start_codon:yes stop_codon:yes gene_type:complete
MDKLKLLITEFYETGASLVVDEKYYSDEYVNFLEQKVLGEPQNPCSRNMYEFCGNWKRQKDGCHGCKKQWTRE